MDEIVELLDGCIEIIDEYLETRKAPKLEVVKTTLQVCSGALDFEDRLAEILYSI